jgi:peptide-methionine (S)-S-oxide reductase
MDVTDHRYLRALAAIDSGNVAGLVESINECRWLVRDRIVNNEKGYFRDPYLLWFVADNPVRAGRLPRNIVEITAVLLQAVKREAPDTCQYQIDNALALVASGRIPRECGVQMAMLDLLLQAGASPNAGMAALTHGNLEAAGHLVDCGGNLNLALAVCLERTDNINTLAPKATADEKITALAAAAYYGKAQMVKAVLKMTVDLNGFPSALSGFHSHATPLHQAVSSQSLACVKLLVEAGAQIHITDRIYNGTPLDWAAYLKGQAGNGATADAFAEIETYLRSVG